MFTGTQPPSSKGVTFEMLVAWGGVENGTSDFSAAVTGEDGQSQLRKALEGQ